jgi:DNA-binding FadR family transcriptional regulator
MLSPIHLPTAADEVADRLMAAIAMGEYIIGDRLPTERQLAEALRVSRAAIREAFARLEAVGVVETRRGRLGGSYVRSSWSQSSAAAVRHVLLPRWIEFEQLLDLRAMVEEIVGRAATERGTAEDLEAIQAGLDFFRSADAPHDEQIADAAFHRAILTAAHNPQLFALSRSLLSGTSLAFPFEPWGMPDNDRESYREALEQHEHIYEAIVARDVEEAGRATRRHFSLTIDMFRDTIERAQQDAQDSQD